MDQAHAQAVQKYLEGAPAIAVEIVSPGNTAEAMDLKTRLYFEFGARDHPALLPGFALGVAEPRSTRSAVAKYFRWSGCASRWKGWRARMRS